MALGNGLKNFWSTGGFSIVLGPEVTFCHYSTLAQQRLFLTGNSEGKILRFRDLIQGCDNHCYKFASSLLPPSSSAILERREFYLLRFYVTHCSCLRALFVSELQRKELKGIG